MRLLDRLKKAARECSEWRGHDLGRFNADPYWRNTKPTAECKKCDAGVTVCPKPMPNEIDMWGDSLALDCPVINLDRPNAWRSRM